MFVVGLTGDVGAGKSTLVRAWHALGAHIIDADAVAKRQWLVPGIRERAAARWGAEILRGEGVNYARIAEVAFADEAEYRYMINLIHPGTRVELMREASALRGWVVAEVPLLFEAGRYDWIDHVVYVTAPRGSRIERNRARGWSDEEIGRRERFLLGSEEKQGMADLVLRNDEGLEAWLRTAERIGELFRKMSTARELTTCCESLEDAERIARVLLAERLVACVNIEEVRSRYLWKDRLESAMEWSLVCKTTERAMRKAIQRIREHHPYELPAITARDLCGSDAATLQWIVESCE